MRYILELSEEQAEIIKIALEEYFRLRMNQTWDFADDICFDGFDCGSHTPEDFNEWIERRGESKPISRWAKEYGINYQVFHNRVRNLGWSMERALHEPVHQY